ncbi:vicilin-like seed storage protein At2g18540 [Prosopis cineraria]|uniref:vicilin-like seed storage protein At2g18540 n=1 Tax=Prosopis cineraria TaxID=364024 RepID=UPI0024101039|nr:vicilin-like seed storage protein At2g18540 [Prosopis cineraria]
MQKHRNSKGERPNAGTEMQKQQQAHTFGHATGKRRKQQNTRTHELQMLKELETADTKRRRSKTEQKEQQATRTCTHMLSTGRRKETEPRTHACMKETAQQRKQMGWHRKIEIETQKNRAETSVHTKDAAARKKRSRRVMIHLFHPLYKIERETKRGRFFWLEKRKEKHTHRRNRKQSTKEPKEKREVERERNRDEGRRNGVSRETNTREFSERKRRKETERRKKKQRRRGERGE